MSYGEGYMKYKQIDFNSIQITCKIDSTYIRLSDDLAGFYALHSQNNLNDVRLKIITNSKNIIEKSIFPYIHEGNIGKRCIINGRCFFTSEPTIILQEIKFIDKFVAGSASTPNTDKMVQPQPKRNNNYEIDFSAD